MTATVVSAGCSRPTLGDPFKIVEAIPDKQAVVYLYREFADYPLWFDPGIGILFNGADIVDLPKGGYFAHYVAPGENTFTTKLLTARTDAVTIHARSGESYFIKIGLREGFPLYHATITIVSAEVAEREIGALNLVQSTSPSK